MTMRIPTIRGLIVAALLLPSLLASASPRELQVDREKSRATFESAARLETIHGVADEVRGTVEVDPDDLTTARATVVVPVASIRTGIELRDEHLRGERWLDAKRHPEIRFELTRVEGPSRLVEGEEVSAKLHGRLTVHGVTRPVVASAKIKWARGAVEAKARFTLKLSEHGVEIPSVVQLKVADEITVRVQLRAS
mgnify:CR=1 FL=1